MTGNPTAMPRAVAGALSDDDGVPSTADRPAPRRRTVFGRASVVEWLHAVAVVAVWLTLRGGVDRTAWVTVAGYGPRWPWLVPGAVLLLARAARGRFAWLTLAALGVAAVTIAGFNLPLHRLLPHGDGPLLRVLALNVDGLDSVFDAPAFRRQVDTFAPDVMTFEEAPGDAAVPPALAAYDVRRETGLVVASRWPVRDVRRLRGPALGGEGVVLACRLERSPGQFVWAVAVHLETPRRGLMPLLEGRRDGVATMNASLERRRTEALTVRRWLQDTVGDEDVIVAGDFNLVADGRTFREAFSPWRDAFADAGFGVGGTKLEACWRARIDHVLSSPAWRAARCWAGDDVGSDHLPVLAELRRE